VIPARDRATPVQLAVRCDHAKQVGLINLLSGCLALRWNTIFFEKDVPVTIENVKLEHRALPKQGKGLARFKRAVRSIIVARRFLGCAARVGISITNGKCCQVPSTDCLRILYISLNLSSSIMSSVIVTLTS